MRFQTLILTLLGALLAPTSSVEATETTSQIVSASEQNTTEGEKRSTERSDPRRHPRSAFAVAKDLDLVAAVDGLLQVAPSEVGPTVAQVLEHLSPPERTQVVCLWALSPHRPLRLALAEGAAHVDDVPVGLRSALDRLASDEDPEIRAAASASIRARTRTPDA